MKKVVHKIGSVFLAGLVLVASAGFVVNVHECAGRILSVALYGKAKPCFATEASTCSDVMMGGRHCCADHAYWLQGDDTVASQDVVLQTPDFQILDIELPVIGTISLPDEQFVQWLDYSPPDIYRDIPVSVQSFLI